MSVCVAALTGAAAGCGDPQVLREGSEDPFYGPYPPATWTEDAGVFVGSSGSKGIGGGSADATSGDAGRWDPTADGTCFEAHEKPETIEVPVTVTRQVPKPVALYLMQDRSSSMVGLCDLGVACNPFAWQQTSDAIRAFASDPKSAGFEVGLGFFPPVGAVGPTQGSCDGSSCVAAVPMSTLPAAATALDAALDGARPSSLALLPNYTPTECGMNGMVNYCREYQLKTGTECVAVLITDGAPNRCSTSSAVLTAIAAQGKAAGVKTFAIGMAGANFTLLNAIAQAGGTDCDASTQNLACDVSKGDTLLEALTQIREFVTVTETRTETQTKPLECEWAIPEPPAGQVFDPRKVNLQVNEASGEARRIGFVGTAEQCDAAGGQGWYFDSATSPTRVLVCPGTCAGLQASQGASVDLAFGCARETAPGVVIR